VKKLIKQFLRSSFGIVAINQKHCLARYIDHPKLTPFDHVLLRCFDNLNNLRFVQIGANDGKRGDPINALINHYAWHGAMLEPDAIYFASLTELHGRNPRLKLLNVALSDECGEKPLYVIRQDIENLPDWAKGLGSLSRERVLTAVKEIGLTEDVIVQKTVATITWREIRKELGNKAPDVLVLDTEGYDIFLLRLAELQEYRPKVILFEHSCVSIAERLSFYRDLLSFGYEILTDGGDTIAYRSKQIGSHTPSETHGDKP
jgi:FkbM family methyltransferase